MQKQLKLAPKLSENHEHNCEQIENTRLTSLVFLWLAEYSQLQQAKNKKSSFQVFLTRFRMRMVTASSGLLSAIRRSDRRGVSGSPPVLMWRMLSCHLSAFKAFWRRGPPGPSHALRVRQSGGSPPPPPPPPQPSALYIISDFSESTVYIVCFPIVFCFLWFQTKLLIYSYQTFSRLYLVIDLLLKQRVNRIRIFF